MEVILNSPLLSIITPCWNSEDTISDTLVSIADVARMLSSQARTIEVIFVDGRSTDNTLGKLRNFCNLNNYSRIIFCSKVGPYPAMNKGIKEAKGAYIHILNSDDCIWDPVHYVEEIYSINKLNCDVLLSPILYFKRPSYRIYTTWFIDTINDLPSWKSLLKKGLHYPHPGFIAKTVLYQKFLFDESYKLSADYKLMHQILIRMSDISKLYVSKHILVGMAHGGLTSHWKNILRGISEIRAINCELNINTSIFFRYARKFIGRLLIRK